MFTKKMKAGVGCLATLLSSALVVTSFVPLLSAKAATEAEPNAADKFVLAQDFESIPAGTAASDFTVKNSVGSDGTRGAQVTSFKTTGTNNYVLDIPSNLRVAPGEGAEYLWFHINTNEAVLRKGWITLTDESGANFSPDDHAPTNDVFYQQNQDGTWKTERYQPSDDPAFVHGGDNGCFIDWVGSGYARIKISNFGKDFELNKKIASIKFSIKDCMYNIGEDPVVYPDDATIIIDNIGFSGASLKSDVTVGDFLKAHPGKIVKPGTEPQPDVDPTDPNVPDPGKWEFVMGWDLEDKEVGASADTWGGYSDICTDTVLADIGADGSKGLKVYYDINSSKLTGGLTQYVQPYYNEGNADADMSGATELWFWLDMTDYQTPNNMSLRPRINGTEITLKPASAYYMQTANGWKSCLTNESEDPASKCAILGSDLNGFKGYVRIPLDSFRDVPATMKGLTVAYQVYDFSFAVDDMECYMDNGFVMDNWMLVGPDMANASALPVTKLFDGSMSNKPGEITDAMKAAAKTAKDAIAALPTTDKLTLDDEEAVAAAREKVNAVDESAIGLVDNLTDLVNAEKKIKELKDAAAAAEADKAAAQKVIDMIAGLKKVDDIRLEDEAAIAEVRKAYDGLTAAQQNLVTNAKDLEAAEGVLAKLKNVKPEDPKPEWKYLNVSDFDKFEDGYDFSSERDEDNNYKYMFDPCGTKGKKYGSFITKNGYNGGLGYTMKIVGDEGSYAQPLLRLDKLNGGTPLNYDGAEELTMYVDFTNIKMDGVGLDLRLIVNDKNADGTSSGKMTQYALKEGGFVYMMSPAGNWVKANVTSAKKLPTAVTGRIAMEPGDEYPTGADEIPGYKGLIRIPVGQLENISGDANDLNGKMDLDSIAQLWMIFNCPDKQDGNYFVIDQLGFDGNFTTAGQGEVDVLDMLPLSSGSDETGSENKPDDNKEPEGPKSPVTGYAVNFATIILCLAALGICLHLRKKAEN